MHPGQKLKPGARVVFDGRAALCTAKSSSGVSMGRRPVRLWTEDGRRMQDAVDRDRPRAAAAVHQARRPRRGSRALSDGLRARARIGRRADRGSALHRRAARALARARRRASPRSRFTSATARSSRCASTRRGSSRRARALRHLRARGRAPSTRAHRRRAPRHRRRDDDDAHARSAALDARTARSSPAAARPTLFIYPGFAFRVVAALLTNFHLPKSSLLMLVSAFAGRERVLAAYRDAVARGYRFYSYGDAMLILNRERVLFYRMTPCLSVRGIRSVRRPDVSAEVAQEQGRGSRTSRGRSSADVDRRRTGLDSLPQHAGRRRFQGASSRAIVDGEARDGGVVWGLGAHVIKTGARPGADRSDGARLRVGASRSMAPR